MNLFDIVAPLTIEEAKTDYQKKRERERAIDLGKPVSKQREPRMTDYQKRRAEQKRQEALGENSWSGPDNAWSSEHNEWTAEDAQIGPDSTSPVGGNVQEEKLNVGDPVIVTATNEFEGKTGEISEFSPSGKFVIVNLYNYGKHSMHLSDIEYNDYADDENNDDWYDEDLNEFAPSSDRDDNNDDDRVPNDLHRFANLWWNAADPKEQERIADQLATGGWTIQQVDYDHVQLKHRGGQEYVISDDEFDGDLDEGWSDAIVAQRTGQPRTPYSVYIKGKKWKDFENDDHAEAVANKLQAKFKAEGRDPGVITIAPTDYDKDIKEADSNEFRPVGPITIVPPKKLKSGETYQDRNKYWQSQGQAPIYKTTEAGSPAQQAAIAINMKKSGKKPAQVNEEDQVKKVFKDKSGKPVGEIGIDPESSPGNGEWYVYHYATGYSVVGFDSAAEAKRELMYVHKHPEAVEGHPSTKEQGVAEGQLDELSPETLKSYIKKSKGHSQKYDQLGNKADEKGDEELANKMWNKGDNRYAGDAQARNKLADLKDKKKGVAEAQLDEIKKGQKDSNGVGQCWPGYVAKGTKQGKNGPVRNCVKKEDVAESYWTRLQDEKNTRLNSLVNELKESIK